MQISFNDNVWIHNYNLTEMRFLTKSKSAFVVVMPWCQRGDKLEPYKEPNL